MRNGWIKLHRSLADSPMWTQKPFDEAHAWLDLLLLAQYEERTVREADGQLQVWKPGEVRHSKNMLADRWGWTRYKIDSTLKRWENESRIAYRGRRAKGSVITILGWDKYQNGKRQEPGGKKKVDYNHSQPPSGLAYDEKVVLVEENGERVARRVKKSPQEMQQENNKKYNHSQRLTEEYEKVKVNGRWLMRPRDNGSDLSTEKNQRPAGGEVEVKKINGEWVAIRK